MTFTQDRTHALSEAFAGEAANEVIGLALAPGRRFERVFEVQGQDGDPEDAIQPLCGQNPLRLSRQEIERRPVTHCKAVSETPGVDGRQMSPLQPHLLGHRGGHRQVAGNQKAIAYSFVADEGDPPPPRRPQWLQGIAPAALKGTSLEKGKRMKILFIFTICLNIAGSDDVTTVTGYRGRSVQIKCHYDSGYEDYNKYLCRGECPHWPGTKDIPVQSGPPVKDTRFSLYDDTTTKIFTVTITDLRAEDANTYWCVVERTGLDIYTNLQLLVEMDVPASSTVSQTTHNTYSATTHITSPSVHPETPPATDNLLNTVQNQTTPSLNDVPGSATYILISTGVVLFSAGVIIFCRRKCQAGSDAVTTVTGYRGRSVQIECRYEPGYEEYKKYLCRGACNAWKHVLVDSKSPAEDTRFSLYDDTTAKIFTITITGLRAEDEDTYWCGIERTGRDIYTELQLLVKLDVPASSTVSQSTHTTYSATTHFTSPSVHPETPPATTTSLITAEHHTTAPSPDDVPGVVTYIMISTGAVVFIVVVIIAIYSKRKCQGPVTSSKEDRCYSSSFQCRWDNTTGSDAVTTVTGYRGRSVQIKCHYESGYEEYNKYLCRGECPGWPATKDIPVQSGSPAEDTRFSLYDYTTAKIFIVTITDLRAEDANTYWCGIERSVLLKDIYTELQLLVVDDPARSSVSPSTHTTYSASPHITSPSVHTETPPATG
ncbi:CMRF35-like molecule 3 [Silurus meridionalis]|nr:CMRF35-like molecule 3 [Silurus meridionalis]